MSDVTQAKERMTHPLLREEAYTLLVSENLTVETEDNEKTFKFSLYKSPGNKEEAMKELRIELTKEDDIYFIAMKEFDEKSFREFAKKAKVKFDFNSFANKLELVVGNVNTNRTVYSAEFKENKLTFKQKLQFKTVQLFQIPFDILNSEEDEYVDDQAQFRFEEKTALVNSIEEAYNKLCEHVQKNNKQLYSQLRRGQEFNATRSMK